MPLVNLGSYTEEFGRSIQLPKCNRGACTNTFAPCFNRGTNTYYCVECAQDINYLPLDDGTYLCEIPERDDLIRMGHLWYGGWLYVGTKTLEQANLPKSDRGEHYPSKVEPIPPENSYSAIRAAIESGARTNTGRRTIGSYRGAKGKGGV